MEKKEKAKVIIDYDKYQDLLKRVNDADKNTFAVANNAYYKAKQEDAALVDKYSIFVFVFGTIMAIFIPSTKNLLIIYGVGGTIDYLKDNKDANKIPDKCIKALDKYLDDALTEDKNKE